MSKAKSFWIFMGISLPIALGVIHAIKLYAPLAHEVLLVLSQIGMIAITFRWCYEHWRDE